MAETCPCNNSDEVIATIYQADDTNAFGRHFIKVNAPKGIEASEISKVIFQCGKISKEYENPTFPFYIDLTSEETKLLSLTNKCHMLCLDKDGNRQTLEGEIILKANKQVVK